MQFLSKFCHNKQSLRNIITSLCVRMSVNRAEKYLLEPPSCVRGMKKLDIEQFSKTVEVPYVLVPQENIGSCMPILKRYLLKMRNLNPVQSEGQSLLKKVLLDPSKVEDKLITTFLENMKAAGLTIQELKTCSINLTYDNWTTDDIFKAVLPPDQEGLTSFSIIGHIYHVNLRDHLLEYKTLIGQVLLDKNSLARTVVNKVNSIDSTYRIFQIEVLAGEDDMIAKVKENHCSFVFDFSRVYWNPRLVGEHERIVKEIQEGDILFDVFAGVGPFAIPAAKKGCTVLANDLNPNSFKWLQHNILINKVVDKVKAYNKDGADFICHDVKDKLLELWNNGFDKSIHMTMNLPALAVEFLPYFRGLFSNSQKLIGCKFPIVHVYCFVKDEDDPMSSAKKVVECYLRCKLGKDLKTIFHVRTVSNKKEMIRVSFSLSEEILFEGNSDENEPAAKRPCFRNEAQN